MILMLGTMLVQYLLLLCVCPSVHHKPFFDFSFYYAAVAKISADVVHHSPSVVAELFVLYDT